MCSAFHIWALRCAQSSKPLNYYGLSVRFVAPHCPRLAPEHGGWNAHCTYSAGFDLLTPGTNLSLNAIGRPGFVGWPTNATLTSLRNQWLDAADLAEQQRICRDIQTEFWKDPPYFPL